jgi:hypothetical protein
VPEKVGSPGKSEAEKGVNDHENRKKKALSLSIFKKVI